MKAPEPTPESLEKARTVLTACEKAAWERTWREPLFGRMSCEPPPFIAENCVSEADVRAVALALDEAVREAKRDGMRSAIGIAKHAADITSAISEMLAVVHALGEEV